VALKYSSVRAHGGGSDIIGGASEARLVGEWKLQTSKVDRDYLVDDIKRLPDIARTRVEPGKCLVVSK